MKSIFYFLFTALLFAACEQETIATLNNSSAVVAGYVFVGQPVDSIRITKSFSYAEADTTLITLDELDVFLQQGNTRYALQSIGDGYYQNLEVQIEADKIYALEFQYEGETVYAETYTPPVKPVTSSVDQVALYKIDLNQGFQGAVNIRANAETSPIELRWENPENDYYYVVVENLEENPEDVVVLPDGLGFGGQRFQFISRPQIVDFYAIQPQRELQQFGKHRAIVFRVNPEYAALYELNGSSSVSITQPPSNVKNGLGIFTGVSSDTIFFEVTKR